MPWELVGKDTPTPHLQHEEFRLPLQPGTLALASPVTLIPGLAQLTVAGGPLVGVDDGATLVLTAEAEPIVTLNLRPVILFSSPQDDQWVSWPLKLWDEAAGKEGTGGTGFDLPWRLPSGFRCPLEPDVALLQALTSAVTKLAERLPSPMISCRTFDFPLGLLPEGVNQLGGLRLTPGKPEIVMHEGQAHLALRETTARFDLLDADLVISELRLRLSDLHVDVGSLQARLGKDVAIGNVDAAPASLFLHAGCEFGLDLRMVAPELHIKPPAEGPAVSVVVPGCVDYSALVKKPRPDRLIFDLYPPADAPAENAAIVIGPAGLRGDATLRRLPFDLPGLDGCQLSGGRLQFLDGQFDAEVVATARLPYFRNSEGSLTLRAGSKQAFSATWALTAGQTWTDPTENFQVHQPRAAVTVAYQGGQWTVGGKLGGELEFIGGARLEGAAREWLGDLANDLRMEFDDLALDRLAGIASTRIKLSLPRLPSPMKLWSILRLDLESFSLLEKGFSIGGRIRLGDEDKGLSLEGRLPQITVKFEQGAVRLSLDDGGIGFSGKLTTPAGISVALELERYSDGRVEELRGSGSVSIPSMPAIAVTCAFGQRKRKAGGGHDPVLLLYAKADIPIPLFPGVVLRQPGLGFGINKVLKVVHETPHDELVRELVNGPKGLPNPADQASWTVPDSDATDVSFIADTLIAPAQQGDHTFPYVAAATLYAKPTGDFVILLGANLWLMTSLVDANREEFRRHPVATGAMALFPRHGYLELQVRTKTDPRMTEPVELVAAGLRTVSGELYVKATRDDFLFRVGPFRGKTTMEGIELSGQVTFATYVGAKGALAVMQASLEGRASLSDQVTLGFGPLTVTAGFRFDAAVAFETVMAGMYLPSIGFAMYQRVRVYAAVSLAVWAEVRFRLVIRFWRFSKTIEWSASHSASLSLSVDLWLEVVVASEPALYGHARVHVELFGYGFSPSLTIGTATHPSLSHARGALADLLTSNK